jgi:hypothetical protein
VLRRSPKPLAMPMFGTPADGRQCRTCGRWFYQTHFWRPNLNAFVNRCADCIRKGRRPTTGTVGKKSHPR